MFVICLLVVLIALPGVLSVEEPNLPKLDQLMRELSENLTRIERKVVDQSWCTRGYPRNCQDVKITSGQNISGVYFIKPDLALEGFLAYCDMETQGGGWTTVLNRFDGSQNFCLNWTDYKNGFGHLSGEFWLGLEKLYSLTGSEVNELLVELEDWESTTAFARYARFAIGSEAEKYPIKLIEYSSGNASDSLAWYHSGLKFTTMDADHDPSEKSNCASIYCAGWWYNTCASAALTEKYKKGTVNEKDSKMFWGSFKGIDYGLKKARMMVRPVNKIPSNRMPPIYN